MKIVLASQSPYRKKQLKDLGYSFRISKPQFNEDLYKKLNITPKKLASLLAQGKAKSLKKKYPKSIIIGADQLIVQNGKILGKPGNASLAKKQLKMMSGRQHQLITALCVLKGKKTITKVITAKIKMRKLSSQDIEKYVQKDKPFDCAGSYRFEKGGFSLIDSIIVSDPSALIGLPLIELSKILKNWSPK